MKRLTKLVILKTIAELMILFGVAGLILVLTLSNAKAETESGYLNRLDSIFTVCVKGYLFVVYKGYSKGGVVQILKEGSDGFGIRPPQPMKCETLKQKRK